MSDQIQLGLHKQEIYSENVWCPTRYYEHCNSSMFEHSITMIASYEPSNYWKKLWSKCCIVNYLVFYKKVDTYVVGYEKRDHFVQNAIFAIFQTVTIPRPQEPQASHLVYRQFGPSTSQIQR